MKKSIITIVLSLSIYASAYSLNYTEIQQDYNQALKLAKEQKKLILIDFYTTWCVPCKVLDKRVFQDSIMSQKIGKDFIVLRYDAEKDSVFHLSMKHHIGSYPSLIILNNNGFVLNKMYGFGGADKDLESNFTSFVDKALVSNLENKYYKGISNSTELNCPQFYKNYILRISEPNADSVAKFWASQTDFSGEIPFSILCYFGGSSTMNQFFIDNRPKFLELYGLVDVEYATNRIVYGNYSKAIKIKDRKLLEKTHQLVRDYFKKETVSETIELMEEDMLIGENRWKEAIVKFESRKNKKDFSEEEINSFSWNAFEKCEDKSVLKKCTEWMKTLTDEDPQFASLDTYARLLYKIGEFKKAKPVMQKAIEIAKKEGSDFKESEDWLKKLQ